MDKRFATVAALLICCGTGPVEALTAKDTMAVWESASPDDRQHLLDAIGPNLSKRFAAERSALLACMNRTAEAGPHAALLIDEVAHACVSVIEDDDGTEA